MRDQGVCILTAVLNVRAWRFAFKGLTENDLPNPDGILVEELLGEARRLSRLVGILDSLSSVIVSGVATAFIVTRLLLAQRKAKQLVKELGGNTFGSTLPYGRIIALVLESALPFTLVGVAATITYALSDTSDRPDIPNALCASWIISVFWSNGLVSLIYVFWIR